MAGRKKLNQYFFFTKVSVLLLEEKMRVPLPPLVRKEVTMWIVCVRTEMRGEELPT